MHLTLSVEDTNKLREKIGLKLIPTEQHENLSTAENALRERIANTKLRAGITNSDVYRPKPASTTELSDSKPENAPNIESTDSWLNRISQLAQAKEPTPQAVSQSESKPEEHRKSGPIALNVAREAMAPSPDVERKFGKTLNHEIPKVNSRAYDPLDLPSEHRITPLNVPKKAIFKPKKVKLNSTTRERVSKVSPPKYSGVNTDDYYAMLMRSAVRNAHKPETVQSVVSSNTKANTSTVSSTSGFLDRIKNNTEEPESSTDSAVETQTNTTQEDTSRQEEPQRISQNGYEETDEKSSPSIAETLQLLRQQKTRDAPAPTSKPKSRNWARELLNSRKQREKERQELEDKISNLPQSQREEAIALFKQRVNAELSQDAQLLNENYEPEVAIEHRDIHGNVITSKDAFKQMSKAFHGHKK